MLALAAGLRPRRTHADLPPPFDTLAYAPEAQLLIGATAGPLAPAMTLVGQAMRLTRGEALIVRVATTRQGRPTLDLTLGVWTLALNRWHPDLRAYIRPDNSIWLVPDRQADDSSPCFQLHGEQLRPEEAPWVDEAARTAGLAAADSLFARED